MQAKSPVEQAWIQHFSGIAGVGGNIDAELIQGNDFQTSGLQTLRLIISAKNDGQIIVNHLFNNNIGSTTNGLAQKKNLQNHTNNDYAVYIREDQLREYDLLIGLNIYGNAQQAQTPSQSPSQTPAQTPRVQLNPNVMFQHTAQLPPPTIRAKHVIPITAATRKDLARKNQTINGIHDCGRIHTYPAEGHKIAEEKTLAELLATIPNHLSGQAKDEYIIKNFLGLWCYSDDRQSLRFLLLKDLFTNPELVDTQAALHAKAENLIASERAIAKVINRVIDPHNPNAQEKSYYFHMLKTKNPEDYRPVRKHYSTSGYSRNTTVDTTARQYKFNPATQEAYTRPAPRHNQHDPSPGNMTAKKTAMTLLPTEPAYISLFKNRHHVVIISDLDKCNLHKYKYVFDTNAWTDGQWWYGIQSPTAHNNYDGSTLNYAQGQTHAVNLKHVKDSNARAVTGKRTRSHNEILSSIPRYGIEVNGARNDTAVDRLNALSVMYDTKYEYELDFDLPVFTIPTGEKHKPYTRKQQIKDIIYAYDKSNNGDALWNLCNHLVTQGAVHYKTNGSNNPDDFTYYFHNNTKFFVIKQFILANRRFLTQKQMDKLKIAFQNESELLPLLFFKDKNSLLIAEKTPATDAEWQKAVEQIEKLSGPVKLSAQEQQTLVNNLDALLEYCFKQQNNSNMFVDTVNQVLSFAQDQDVYNTIIQFYGKQGLRLPKSSQHNDALLQTAYKDVLDNNPSVFWANFVQDFTNLSYVSPNATDNNTLLHQIIVNGQADQLIADIGNKKWSASTINAHGQTVFDLISKQNGHITEALILDLIKTSALSCEQFEHIVACLATSEKNLKSDLNQVLIQLKRYAKKFSGGQISSAIYAHLAVLHTKEEKRTSILLRSLLPNLPQPADVNALFDSKTLRSYLQYCIKKHSSQQNLQAVIDHFNFQPSKKNHGFVNLAIQEKAAPEVVLLLAQYWPQDLVTADINGKTAIDELIASNAIKTIITFLENGHTLSEDNLITTINHCTDNALFDELIQIIKLLDLSQLPQVAAHIDKANVVHTIVAFADDPFVLRHLNKHNITLNQVAGTGETPLDVAIENEHFVSATELLKLTSQQGQYHTGESLAYNVVTLLPDAQIRRYADKLVQQQLVHEPTSQGDSPLLWLINNQRFDLANHLVELTFKYDFANTQNKDGQTLYDVIPDNCVDVWLQVFTQIDTITQNKQTVLVEIASYERIVAALLAHSFNLDQQLANFIAVAQPANGQFSAAFYDSLNNALVKSKQNAVDLTISVLEQLPDNVNEMPKQDSLFVTVMREAIANTNQNAMMHWFAKHPQLKVSGDSFGLLHAVCKHKLFSYVEGFAELWPTDLSVQDADGKNPIQHLLAAGKINKVKKLVEKYPATIHEESVKAIVEYCVDYPQAHTDTMALILSQVDFRAMPSVQQLLKDHHLLHRMIESNVDASVFEKVITQDVDLAVTDTDGLSLFELALYKENHNALETLFRQALQLTNNNDDVLYLAVLYGNKEYISQLILQGFKIEKKSQTATISPLVHAIQAGKTDLVLLMVQLALTHSPQNAFVNDVFPALLPHIDTIFDQKQINSLYKQLCTKGYHDIAEQLIPKTPAIFDSELRDEEQNTRLHIAVSFGLPKKTIELLIDQGCLPTSTNAAGKTPFDLAIERQNWDAVTVLLSRLTAAYDATKLAANIFTLFSDKQFHIVTEIFAQSNLTIDYRHLDQSKKNMLHHAIIAGKNDLRSHVLAQNASLLNDVDANGDTPLTLALAKRNKGLIRELIAKLDETHPTESATACFVYLIANEEFKSAYELLNSKVQIDPLQAEQHIKHLVDHNQPDLIAKLRQHTQLQLTENSLFALQAALSDNKRECVQQLVGAYKSTSVLSPTSTSSEFQSSVKKFITYYGFDPLLTRVIDKNDQSMLRFLLQYSHHVGCGPVLKSKITGLMTLLENTATTNKSTSIEQLKMILQYSKDIPEQKQLLFRAGKTIAKASTAGDLKGDISFFSNMPTSSTMTKRTATAAYVTEKLKTLKNEQDILDLVNNLEEDQKKPNNNFLLKPLRMILGWLAYIWKSTNIPSPIKTSSTWSNIMKMAKLRLIHVALEQQKTKPTYKLSQNAQDFLNTNRRGWKVKETTSMHIYNGFFKPSSASDANKATKALHKEDQKLERWVKRKLGGGAAPAA